MFVNKNKCHYRLVIIFLCPIKIQWASDMMSYFEKHVFDILTSMETSLSLMALYPFHEMVHGTDLSQMLTVYWKLKYIRNQELVR